MLEGRAGKRERATRGGEGKLKGQRGETEEERKEVTEHGGGRKRR